MARGAPLTDGRVLLAGGYTGTVDETASTEIVSPTGAFSADGPQMSTGRVFHTVNRLRNGKVLIIGGSGSGHGALASAEVFE